MQFYNYQEKDKRPLMRLVWSGVKIHSTLTDGMGQFTTTMAYDYLKYLMHNPGAETCHS